MQRANYGLRTLDQAPLIRQWIKNAETMGNFKMAWDLEQALLALAHRNPNDLRAVPILREIGDKRLDLLERYVKGEEFPPQIILGCYYDPVRQRLHAQRAAKLLRRQSTRRRYKRSFGRRSDITGTRSE